VTPTDLAILEADSWFGDIPPNRRKVLLEGMQVRSVAAGVDLYSAGDPPNGMWVVLEGEVRLKGYPAAGLELLLPVLRPGTWFGEVSTIDGLPRPTDATATRPTRVAHLSMAAVAHAAAAAPELYRDLAVLACWHQRAALGFVAQTVAHPVRVRLAILLAGLAQDRAGVLQIRQEDLAALVGVSRQTLNRHLKALERERVLDLDYAEITVRDFPRLLELCPEDAR
jgi:CRP/FNR family transcriptional regulator, cyclic AMP receptor protein